jgi:hypothetical protein
MIRERIIAIWEYMDLSAAKLEKLTAIDRNNWYHLRNGRRRANEDDIEAIIKIAPHFAFWLTTGQIAPEIGQVSPEFEEADTHLQGPHVG